MAVMVEAMTATITMKLNQSESHTLRCVCDAVFLCQLCDALAAAVLAYAYEYSQICEGFLVVPLLCYVFFKRSIL